MTGPGSSVGSCGSAIVLTDRRPNRQPGCVMDRSYRPRCCYGAALCRPAASRRRRDIGPPSERKGGVRAASTAQRTRPVSSQ